MGEDRKFLGNHWLVQYKKCNAGIDSGRLVIDNPEHLEKILIHSVESVNAKVLHSACYQFSPQGATAFVLIAESHLSIHTWPEYNCAAFDFFTCSKDMDGDFIVNYIKEELGAGEMFISKKIRYDSIIQDES